MIRNITFYFFILVTYFSFSQKIRPLECSGTIPSFFINNIHNNINYYEDKYLEKQMSDDIQDDEKKLITRSALSHQMLYKQGLILFGDDIYTYLNTIKNKILADQPTLQKQITIYPLKSTAVNAFCTLDGNIFMTLALLSRMESEDEIAFILAHEISHYTQKHLLTNIHDKHEIKKIEEERKKITYDDLLKISFERTKSHELEADSLGLLMLKNTDYNLQSSLMVMDKLGLGEAPMGEIHFDGSFFGDEYLQIPSCFWKKSINELIADTAKNDDYHTHPNIVTRKKHLKGLIQSSKNNQSFTSIGTFEKIQQTSQLAIPSLLLRERRIDEAIYTTYYLIDKYPKQQKDLHTVLCKALYAGAKYKVANEYHFVSRGYYEVKGESQNLYYFLKNLTKKQFNAIAINYLAKVYKQDPNSYQELVPYIKDLIVDQICMEKSGIDYYWTKENVDLKNRYIAKKIAQSKSTSSITLRRNGSYFYRSAFIKFKDDTIFKNAVKQGIKRKEEIRTENFKPYKEKRKEEALKKRKIEKNGHEINAKNVIFLEPDIKFFYQENDGIDNLKKIQKNINSTIQEGLTEYGNQYLNFFSCSNLKSNNTQEYNQYVNLKNFDQQFSNNFIDNIRPLFTTSIEKNIANNAKYFLKLYLVAKGYDNKLYYSFNLYDIHTGKIKYHSYKEVTTNRFENIFLKDLTNIFK